jgi:16S rRNA (uracil1498-N3)-methyltransferase
LADPRFFVETDLAAGTSVDLPASVAHHAGHVLRLRDGDVVVLFNGRGGEFEGRLAARASRVDVVRHDPVERESPVAITLVQSWIAIDKMEWVVEKAVEVGVARIVLAPARRSVVQLDGARLARRLERLRDIVVGACCQCGRNRVPPLEGCGDIRSALERGGDGATGLMLQPDAARSLVDITRSNPGALALAIGPEGGFEASELALAARLGYQPARLGARVLRTETAGLAAIAALQAAVGDFR